MRKKEPTVPQWVCEHCFIHLVNGDCTEPDTCTPGSGDESDPLHLFRDMEITPGMLSSEHDDSCAFKCSCTQGDDCEEHPATDPVTGDSRDSQHHDPSEHVSPDGYECNCETNTYSTSACGGCGSWLYGARYAVTGWVPVAA